MFRIRNYSLALIRLFAAMVVLLISVPALAQTEGQLHITFSEAETGSPAYKVTVTLTGANLIGGAQEKLTDVNGEVQFNALPPGQYELEALSPTTAAQTFAGISIQAGHTNYLEKDLQPVGTAVEIDVVKQRAVDTSSTTSGTTLSKDVLSRIPTGRSYQSAVSMAAGVTGGGGNKNLGGGATNENTSMRDGANITDPVTGTFAVNFNFDAIEQIEVLLGGYMPEYGTSLGGIINIVTESGSNNLEFVTSVYYTNGDWRPKMDARYTSDGIELAPTGFNSQFESYQIASKVSGPLIRDKAFFIISYQQDRSIIAQNGIPQPRDYEGHYLLAKLTVQPTAEHRFTAMLQMQPTNIDNIVGDPFTKAEAQGRQVQGGFINQSRWQWFLSPDVNLDTQFTAQKTYIEVNSVPCTHNEDFSFHPCEAGEEEGNVDWETPGRLGSGGAYNSVNYTSFYFDDRWRYNASSKLKLVSVKDPLGGKHDIKIGVEGEQTVWDQIQGYNGNNLIVDTNSVGFDPETFTNYYWLEISGPIKFRTTGSKWNAFIQDSWKPVSNLTINYGLRFDNFTMRNDLGKPVLAGNLWGPRLFGAWDPWGDQRTKIATGYGRFNDTGRLGTASVLSASSFGSKLYLGEYFFGGDPPLGLLNTAGALYDFDPSENLNVGYDGMRAPRVDELLLQIEREVIDDVKVYSHVTGKFVRFQYELDEQNLVFDSDGSAVIGSRVGDPTTNYYRMRTPALAKRDYFRWDLGFNKIKARRWQAQAVYSYTNSIGSTTNSNSGSFINDPQSQYNYGPLNTDIRHVFKSSGFWDLPTDPWTQSIGVAFESYGGIPDERLYYGENNGSGFGSYDLRIRPRGTYLRYGSYYTLGLRFQQSIDVRKGKFMIDAGSTNIFNNRAPESVSLGFIDSSNRFLTRSRQNPLQFDLGLRYEF